MMNIHRMSMKDCLGVLTIVVGRATAFVLELSCQMYNFMFTQDLAKLQFESNSNDHASLHSHI